MNSSQSRPPISRDYVRLLRDRITPEAWEAIVVRAIEDAQAGDSRARLWIERHALGPHPLSFEDLAVRESLGVESEHEIQAIVEQTTSPPGPDLIETFTGVKSESHLQRALRLAKSSNPNSETTST
jgi:hypothetical protein